LADAELKLDCCVEVLGAAMAQSIQEIGGAAFEKTTKTVCIEHHCM
jgi:hypothetical protein